MPISKDQFIKGLDKTRYQIILFLSEHLTEAYQPIEIAKELGNWNSDESSDTGLMYNASVVMSFRGSLDNLVEDERLNHRVTVEAGLLADEASELLREFFGARRRDRCHGGPGPGRYVRGRNCSRRRHFHSHAGEAEATPPVSISSDDVIT